MIKIDKSEQLELLYSDFKDNFNETEQIELLRKLFLNEGITPEKYNAYISNYEEIFNDFDEYNEE